LEANIDYVIMFISHLTCAIVLDGAPDCRVIMFIGHLTCASVQDGAPDCRVRVAACLASCQAIRAELHVLRMVHGVPLHVCQLAWDAAHEQRVAAK
jgi:hypothetical protein